MTLLSKLFTALVAASSLSVVLGHGGPATTPEDLVRREWRMEKYRRSLDNCKHKIKARAAGRLARRNAMVDRHIEAKREVGHSIIPNPLLKRQSDDPNFCVLAPEVTVGPYYVPGELVRSDIREDEPGIELLVQAEVVDINTCEVVPDLALDVWHCNTTGTYSGFAREGTAGLTNNRGLQISDSDGIVEITTTFPGWYQGRATHIHIAGHLDGSVLANGSYSGGTVAHIGQIFFDEDILDQIDTAEVYNTNDVTRVLNANDGIFNQENTGYDATADVTLVGSTIDDGLVSFISIGVDVTADYSDELSGGGGGPGGPPK